MTLNAENIKAENYHTVGHLLERKVDRIAVLGWKCSEKVTGNIFGLFFFFISTKPILKNFAP